MARRKNDFSEDVRTRVLLWCDRHCCLCKKACGVDIEVDHLKQAADGGSGDIDNAMPLCYDCHASIHRYNVRHPRGTKYRPSELKARREQVYEEFTRHLVPPVNYQVGHPNWSFPEVGFVVQHMGTSLPVKVTTVLHIWLGSVDLGPPPERGHYAGEKGWRLNPTFTHTGHFSIPSAAVNGEEQLLVEVRVTITDVYERPHQLLPVGWVWNRSGKYWYFEP